MALKVDTLVPGGVIGGAKTSPRAIVAESVVSRVRAVFPNAPQNYIIMLINDALVELGMYQTRYVNSKINIEEDKMWYHIGDTAIDGSAVGQYLKLNKLSRVDIMDTDGDYIRIPRLLDKNILLSDADSSETAIEYPG